MNKTIGYWLLVIGGLILIWAMFIFDTSVAVDAYRRVNNLGLLNDQRNYSLIGGFIAIVGVFFIFKNDGEDKSNQSIQPSSDSPMKHVINHPQKNDLVFNGDKNLDNDAYKIFLSKKYNIKRNDLFNKFEVNNSKLFDTLDDALLFAFNEEFKLFDEQDELLKLDNLTQAEETIKNNLTESQWEEAIVSSKKMGKTIVQWREIADQLMDELSITYKNKEYCIRGLNYGYLHDAVNHAKSAKVKNAKCPNCESLVNMLDKECPKCKASFEEMSTWRPKPL
jgi:hypothetical protein